MMIILPPQAALYDNKQEKGPQGPVGFVFQFAQGRLGTDKRQQGAFQTDSVIARGYSMINGQDKPWQYRTPPAK